MPFKIFRLIRSADSKGVILQEVSPIIYEGKNKAEEALPKIKENYEDLKPVSEGFIILEIFQ